LLEEMNVSTSKMGLLVLVWYATETTVCTELFGSAEFTVYNVL